MMERIERVLIVTTFDIVCQQFIKNDETLNINDPNGT